MTRQHRWMAKWDGSGSVEGASVKVCEECGAELIATWQRREGGKKSRTEQPSLLVYVPPCGTRAD